MRIRIKSLFLLAFLAMAGLTTYVGRSAFYNPPDDQEIVESDEDTDSTKSAYDADYQSSSNVGVSLNSRVSKASYPAYANNGESYRHVDMDHLRSSPESGASGKELAEGYTKSGLMKSHKRPHLSSSPYSEMLKGFIQAHKRGEIVDTKKLFSEIVKQQEDSVDPENSLAIQKTAAKDKTKEEEVYESIKDPYAFELEDFIPGPGTLDTKSTVLSKIRSPQDAPTSKTNESMNISEKVLSLGSEGRLELSTRPNEFVVDEKGADLVIYPYKASNSVESINIYVVDDEDQERSYGRVVAMGKPIFIDLESIGLKKIKALVIVDAKKATEADKAFFRLSPGGNYAFAFDIDSVELLHLARRKSFTNSKNKPLKG